MQAVSDGNVRSCELSPNVLHMTMEHEAAMTSAKTSALLVPWWPVTKSSFAAFCDMANVSAPPSWLGMVRCDHKARSKLPIIIIIILTPDIHPGVKFRRQG